MKRILTISLSAMLMACAAIATISCGKGGSPAPAQTQAQIDIGLLSAKAWNLTLYEGSSDNGVTWKMLTYIPETMTLKKDMTYTKVQNPTSTTPATNSGTWAITADAATLNLGPGTWIYSPFTVTATALVVTDKGDLEIQGGVRYTWLRSTYN